MICGITFPINLFSSFLPPVFLFRLSTVRPRITMAGLVVDLHLKAQHVAIKVHPYNYIDDDNNPQLRSTAPPNTQQNKVARIIVILAFLLGLTLTLSAITFSLMWFTLRKQTPTLWLDSFSVPTFNTSDNSTLTAVYDVSVTYKDSHRRCNIYFGPIEVHVLAYKRLLYSNASATVLDPFRLGIEMEKSVNATLEDRIRWFSGDSVSEEIRRNREKGTVNFTVVVRATVTFEGTWWKQNGVLAHSCSDLQVAFSNTTGTGSLIGDVPRKCYKIL